MSWSDFRVRHTGLMVGLVMVILIFQFTSMTPVKLSTANYLPLHSALETVSIVVSFLVFGVVWNAYARDREGNLVILACLFVTVGIIDFLHMLSYKGMPVFVTPGSSEKAIYFWLVARYLTAGALFLVVVHPWRPLSHPGSRYLWLAGSIAFVAPVMWVGLFYLQSLPHTFIEGQGLTPFKISAEYLLVALFITAAVLFLRQARYGASYDTSGLAAAAGVSVLSELCFTLYVDVNDLFNLLGHVFKIVAYLLIYQAVFVASVRAPFQRAREAEAALAQERIRYQMQLEAEVRQRSGELQRSNHDLQQFAYVASHDLQEPLRMVSSYLQLIESRYADKLDQDGHEFIAYAVDGAERLKALIEDLLSYSRVQTQGRPFVLTDMEAVLETVRTDLKLQIKETGAILDHDPLPTVPADARQMHQLLQNLIGNALKFHGQQAPVVHVSTRRLIPDETLPGGDATPGWLFSVRDNGIGIEPEYRERIFVIFQRLHGYQRYHGTGIGLAVCKRIVERHGGAIWVESASGGSIFYFTLPEQQVVPPSVPSPQDPADR